VTALSHPPSVPYIASERQMLEAFLDAMRLAVTRKVDGLTAAQAHSTPTTSSLSLLAILNHLAWTERRWFHDSFGSEPIDDPKWRGDLTEEFSVEGDIEAVVEFYGTQCERSRELVSTLSSLDETVISERFGIEVSLRWIMVHMIEETARHAGHADLIREAIDGQQGD